MFSEAVMVSRGLPISRPKAAENDFNASNSNQKNYRVFWKRQSTYPTYTLTIKFEHPVINDITENHQGTIIFCQKICNNIARLATSR